MKTNIRVAKIELNDELRKYVEDKMKMLDKYLGDIVVINCDVELEKAIKSQNSGNIYRAEVNLSVPGIVLRVEKTEKTIYKAIDKVKDHLADVIKKYKNKKIDTKRGK